jgi:hypothetical protein
VRLLYPQVTNVLKYSKPVAEGQYINRWLSGVEAPVSLKSTNADHCLLGAVYSKAIAAVPNVMLTY